MNEENLITAVEIAKQCNMTRQGVYWYEEKGYIKPIIKVKNNRWYDKSAIEIIKAKRKKGEE